MSTCTSQWFFNCLDIYLKFVKHCSVEVHILQLMTFGSLPILWAYTHRGKILFWMKAFVKIVYSSKLIIAWGFNGSKTTYLLNKYLAKSLISTHTITWKVRHFSWILNVCPDCFVVTLRRRIRLFQIVCLSAQSNDLENLWLSIGTISCTVLSCSFLYILVNQITKSKTQEYQRQKYCTLLTSHTKIAIFQVKVD